jgi:beta-glucanase (GH16 family)
LALAAGLLCLAAALEAGMQRPTLAPQRQYVVASAPQVPPADTQPQAPEAAPEAAAAEAASARAAVRERSDRETAEEPAVTSVSLRASVQPAPSSPPGWPPADQAAFRERFRGAELSARWHVSDGWSNGDLFSTEWRQSQVSLAPDGVTLTMAASTNADATMPYMSAELRSDGWYRYGYFASRLRMPRGGGLVAAFFTFASPISENGQNEIDMEITGRASDQIELTYHVNGRHIREIAPLGFDASEGFHTYAFEWRPDAIRWYIDNRLVHVSRDHVAELDRPQQIFFSLWNSARMPRWLGPIDPAAAPWTMTVSCVTYAPQYGGRALC